MKANRRLLILGALLLVAAWLAIFGDKTPSATVAEPVARAAPAAPSMAANDTAPTGDAATTIEQPVPRSAVVAAPATAEESDLFAPEFVPKPPPPPPPPPQQAPPPPVLKLSFIGKQLADGKWTAFFERDGQVLVGREGTTLDEYRVDAIRDNEVVVTDQQNRVTHIIPTEGVQQ